MFIKSERFRTRAFRIALAVASGALCTQSLAGDKESSLSQQLANPIADLISVPIQYNALFGAGRDGKGTLSVLDIQPVIPIHLNEDWNLITRTILPVTYASNVFNGSGNVRGPADTQMSLFLSPQAAGPGGLIWGVGSIVNMPTATDALLGTRKWGAGPTGVALVQKGDWTVGVLANQLWTFDSSKTNNDNVINKSFIQPWATYELGKGRSVSVTTQSSYDWINRQWTVPLNIGYAQVVNFGKQPVQIQVGGIYMLTAPTGAPKWGLQATLTFLFPES